jgi:peptidoglycan/LPS O-acetylase OafA/YrhL
VSIALPSKPTRIHGLDGLRAVSIAMVMASHLAGSSVLGGGRIPLGSAHAWGKVGVRVFFVISGFLITKLLLGERALHGGVSVRAFYVRRAFRILPAYGVYLLALVALSAFGAVELPLNDLVHAATYTTNFDVERSWLVSHIWSLSVEEHYYLLWPVAFALLRPRHAFYVALTACVVSPVSRYLVVTRLPEHLDSLVWQATPCVADSIATGSLLAFARDPSARVEAGPLAALFERVLGVTRRSAWTYLLMIAAFLTYRLETRPTLWTLVGVGFSNVAFALAVDRAVTTQADPFGRLLTTRVLERVGVLSYSLYLWQQIFLRQSAIDGPGAWATLCAFPLNVLIAFGLAHVSYELVERRVLRMRPRSADR